MQYTRRQFTHKALLATVGYTTLAQQLFAQATDEHYIVRRGDTLGHIALRNGVSVSELKQLNNLKSDTVRIGQKLRVSTNTAHTSVSTTTYVVQQGDTLGHIALRYGTTVSSIKASNNLNSDLVRVGQKLQIPNSSSTLNSTPATNMLASVRAATAQINVRRDNWKRIVAHHSAIKYGNAAVYDRAHRKRGMQNGLAYHFIIGNGIDSGDGEIEIGPRWTKQLLGGHVKSYQTNLTAIGICLVGNFEKTHPSKKQLDAFTQLMDWLQRDVLKKKTLFAGHRELKSEQTICPGKNFPLAAMHARYD